jgi:nucleoside-diphosphate-sugar epimerase
MANPRHVFITGGTGYMGRRLIPLLLDRGHTVTAVAREGSERKLPSRCEVIVADVLDRKTWEHHLRRFHTVVHLVGVAHPSPSKALEFIDIDLRSTREAIEAARKTQVEHFVYVSVAHPAPAMKSYVMVRTACEEAIREAGLNTTVLRPWYVLGPGHWWPLALLPIYKVAEILPWTSSGAKRLGLIKLEEMIAALAHAVENPAGGTKIVEVPGIRAIAKTFV